MGKDMAPTIAWRKREAWREQALYDLPSKDKREGHDNNNNNNNNNNKNLVYSLRLTKKQPVD